MFPQDSERENRSVKPNMTVLYIRTFTYLFTCVATDCVFCPGATVEPASPYIGREAWFIATLIGAIGSLIWLAVCILCIFIYRRCRRCGRFNKASNLAGLLSPVRFYNGVELQACSDEMSVVVSFPYFGNNQWQIHRPGAVPSLCQGAWRLPPGQNVWNLTNARLEAPFAVSFYGLREPPSRPQFFCELCPSLSTIRPEPCWWLAPRPQNPLHLFSKSWICHYYYRY